jgi:hypothetical protein
MARTSNPIGAHVGPFAAPNPLSSIVIVPDLPSHKVTVNLVPRVTVRGTGIVPRSDIINTDPAQQQVNVAAAGAPISLVFGRNRLAGKVMQPILLSNDLLIPCMLGGGEFDALEAIELDNKPAPASVLYNFYPGNFTQAADPWLATAWSVRGKTYLDTLRGISYVVVRIPNDPNINFQSLAFVVRGTKVYDPRDGTQSLSDPTTWKYSNNAALVLAYFLSAPGIGPEDTMDWTSVGDVATIDDQVVGSEKRRTVGVTFDQVQDVDKIEETLRAYAGCWVVRENGVTRLVADAPATSVFHFTKGKYRLDTVQIKARGRGNAPTVVTVQYTDTSSSPWKTIDSPDAIEGRRGRYGRRAVDRIGRHDAGDPERQPGATGAGPPAE